MDFLELFRSQLNGPVMERLGGVLGLDAAQAQQIGQAVLPAQLKVITDKVATTAGAQHVLDLAAQGAAPARRRTCSPPLTASPPCGRRARRFSRSCSATASTTPCRTSHSRPVPAAAACRA